MSEAKSVVPMPTREAMKQLSKCETLSEAFGNAEFMQRIRQSVPKHISPDRMLRTFVQAVSKTPDLMKCNMRSVLGSMLSCSQLGFEPNTPLGLVYLIPFKGRQKQGDRWVDVYDVQLIIGYQGLLDLSYRSRMLTAIHCDVVFPSHEFTFEYGSNAHLRHVPRARPQNAVPDWAYMHAKLSDGQAFEVMPYNDVLEIRNRSQGYRAALAQLAKARESGRDAPRGYTETPWVAHEFAMARKTALRAGSKWLPKSIEMANTLALDDAQDQGRVDFGAALEAPMIDGQADYLSGALDGAERGDPGAAHGVREQQTEQAQQQRRQPAETAAKPVQQKPAAPAPAEQKAAPAPQPAAEAAGFEAYLIGADGEVVEDVFTDAVAFAEALVDHVGGGTLSDDKRAALMEHNADAIEAVRAVPAAAAVLARLDGADHEAAEPIEVALPFIRGNAAWPDYLKAAKERLATVNAATLGAFVQANAATIAQAPAAQRLLVVKAVTERAQALGVAAPPGLADLAKSTPKPAAAHDEAAPAAQQAAPAYDADEAWCKAIAEDVGKMATAGEIKAYATSGAIVTKMKRLKTERPELFRRLDDFIAQRLAFIADTSPAGK